MRDSILVWVVAGLGVVLVARYLVLAVTPSLVRAAQALVP